MLKRLLISCSLLLLFSLAGGSQPASAHELLPAAVVQYMQEHPQASADEVKEFMLQTTPGFAAKYANQQDIITIIKDQQTSLLDNAWDFLKLGVQHILSGPDHILFVISLLLVFVSLRDILRLTLTFTFAHSITLVLAGTGLLVLSSRVVEPFIALSIAYVAFTTVFLRHKAFFADKASKIGTVFFFGLFHGLGFAGVLQEIQIPANKFVTSLLSFNVGIEVGQLCIVILAVPIFLVCRRLSWYNRLIQVLAALITLVGLIWAVQRVFFS